MSAKRIVKRRPNHKLPEALRKNMWKKGQSGNPEGGRLHTSVISRVRRLTREQLSKVGTLLLEGDIEALSAIAAEGDPDWPTPPKHSALEVWLARIIVTATKAGTSGVLDTILDRIVGRVPESLELSGADGGPIETARYSAEERKALLSQYRQKLDETDDEGAEELAKPNNDW